MGELGALFNPGMRHEIEERQSKANRREEEGNARDGDLRIDLASGVAVINVPGRPGEETRDDRDGEPTPAVSAEAAAEGRPAAHRSGQHRAAELKPAQQNATQQSTGQQKSGRQTAARQTGVRQTAARKKTAASASGRRAQDASDARREPATPRTGQVPSSKASRAAR